MTAGLRRGDLVPPNSTLSLKPTVAPESMATGNGREKLFMSHNYSQATRFKFRHQVRTVVIRSYVITSLERVHYKMTGICISVVERRH